MKVGMLGCGVVGSGVKKILDEGKTEAGSDLQLTRILVKEIGEGMDARFTECADDVLDDPDIDVVVECMGGIEPAGSFVEKALAGGKSVVTSNKRCLRKRQPGCMHWPVNIMSVVWTKQPAAAGFPGWRI